MWVKNLTDFLRFCYINIPCLRITTTLAFPYKALQIWIKRFSEYLAYELSQRLDSWRGCLYIYLHSFPDSGWTLSIHWFAFLFLMM